MKPQDVFTSDFCLLDLILEKKKERIWENTAEAVEKRSFANCIDTEKNDKTTISA